MSHIGLFEVDCREKAEDGNGLSFVPRALPFQDQIERIYGYADKQDIPIIFTTCCADRLPTQDDSRGALVVPMDSADTDWLQDLPSARLVCLEKRTWGSPKNNKVHCAWDMFRHNGNADRLFEALGIQRWVVFGVGIDLCVSSAVKGLLQAGLEVVILDDILTNNAGGTPETMKQVIGQLCDMGATTQPFSEFLQAGQTE